MKTLAIFSKDLSLKGLQNEELITFHSACKRYAIGWCLDGTPISVDVITGKFFKLGRPFLYCFLKEQYNRAHDEPGALERFGEKFDGALLRRLIDLYIGMLQDTIPRVFKKDDKRQYFHEVIFDEKKSYTGE